MNFRVVRLADFSGEKATIYSVILEGDEADKTSLFEHFLNENQQFPEEVKDILKRLTTIGHKTGSQDNFFKDFEGRPGDGVCALYDDPDRKLRLYCIRFGHSVLVIGGGGHKPKGMKALQESEKLTTENNIMRLVSGEIARRIKEKDLRWSENGNELIGDFDFYEDEQA